LTRVRQTESDTRELSQEEFQTTPPSRGPKPRRVQRLRITSSPTKEKQMSTGSAGIPGEQIGDIDGRASTESAPRTQQLADQAQEKAQQAAGQAQEKAQQAAGQAKNRLREQIDQRSSQAAEQINSQASDLRAVSDSLREQGKQGPADAAAKLADYGERVGGYLRDRDSDSILHDAEEFGRRRPWAVVAGGAVLGMAAARFLKASSSRRYSELPSRAAMTPSAGYLGGPGAPVGPEVPATRGPEYVAPPPSSVTPGDLGLGATAGRMTGS
jgi:ElaB/YqjD/DUF883 family membrane-anchored ribosome-binding protein